MAAVFLRQNLFDAAEFGVHHGIEARALIRARYARSVNQHLSAVKRIDRDVALPIGFVQIVAALETIVVFTSLIALLQQGHHCFVFGGAFFQRVFTFLRYGGGVDGRHRLRLQYGTGAAPFAYQRRGCVQAALEFVKFQHGCRRAFVRQRPCVCTRHDFDFCIAAQRIEQGLGLPAAELAIAVFVKT